MNSSTRPPASSELDTVARAPDYFLTVGRAVERIANVRDRPELIEVLQEAATCLGASQAYFASFVQEDPSFESYRFLLACDPLWGLEYEQALSQTHDPWLAHARSHSEPRRASEIACTSDAQSAVVQLAERFGFLSAIVVPAPASRGLSRLGTLVLGSETRGFFEGDGYNAVKILARSLAMELHERFHALLRQELLTKSRLTPSELVLLIHAHEGLPTKRIAQLMGLTAEAVDVRFWRLNAKLESPSRHASARLAAEYGLI